MIRLHTFQVHVFKLHTFHTRCMYPCIFVIASHDVEPIAFSIFESHFYQPLLSTNTFLLSSHCNKKQHSLHQKKHKPTWQNYVSKRKLMALCLTPRYYCWMEWVRTQTTSSNFDHLTHRLLSLFHRDQPILYTNSHLISDLVLLKSRWNRVICRCIHKYHQTSTMIDPEDPMVRVY